MAAELMSSTIAPHDVVALAPTAPHEVGEPTIALVLQPPQRQHHLAWQWRWLADHAPATAT